MPTFLTQLIVVLAIGIAIAPADWTLALNDAEKRVLRVEALTEGQTAPGLCSAVVIGKGYVVTAAHCVPAPPAKSSITVAGEHAEVAKFNALLDLAVLKTDTNGARPVLLAPDTPPAGTPVVIVGYPFGIEQIAAQFGYVALPLNTDTKTLWINAEIIPGNSGGAVLDAAGRLVGINSRIYYSGPSRMGAAIPVEAIRKFVKPYLPKVQG